MAETGGRARAFCVYCGTITGGARYCRAHRDLVELDPNEQPARRRTGETELGVSNPWKVPKRGGREELY